MKQREIPRTKCAVDGLVPVAASVTEQREITATKRAPSEISPAGNLPGWLWVCLFLAAAFPRALLGWLFPQFSGDLARDVYSLQPVLKGYLLLIGPHIGHVGSEFPHLGPLGYYLMLPFLLISRFQLPQLGNIPIVVLDSVASLLILDLVRRRFGLAWGVLAWGVYAFSVNNIFWGSFYWNCNYGTALVIVSLWLLDSLQRNPVRSKGFEWLLAGVLIALTQMHVVFGCFVLATLVYVGKMGWQDLLKKAGVLAVILYFPYLVAEVQSNFGNLNALVQGSPLRWGNWPLGNFLYLVESAAAFLFWHDKMHLDLNAFVPGEGWMFWFSLIVLSAVVIGLIMNLRRERHWMDGLLSATLILLLLFPSHLNAERYWLFALTPLTILALVGFLKTVCGSAPGKVMLVVFLVVYFGYNLTVSADMIVKVSQNKYAVSDAVMINVQSAARRAEALLAYAGTSDLVMLSSEATAESNRGFLPFRYFAALEGKRILAASVDAGRIFTPTYYFPPLPVEPLPGESDRVDVYWMYTPGEEVSVRLPPADTGQIVYWSSYDGQKYYIRYLGVYPYAQSNDLVPDQTVNWPEL